MDERVLRWVETRGKIVSLRNGGYPWSEVAHILNLSVETCKKYYEENNDSPRTGEMNRLRRWIGKNANRIRRNTKKGTEN